MAMIIGSARSDERGKLTGGKAGDQKNGAEVSVQAFYNHTKGWNVLRPKTVANGNALANAMQIACNNNHLGYDQNERLGVIKHGIKSTVDTECDCSSLVRACVIYAMGKDAGNFTTVNEKSCLMATGLFDDKGKYSSGMTLCNGDVLVTCTKGHTAIVVSGNPRKEEKATVVIPSTCKPTVTYNAHLRDLQSAMKNDGIVSLVTDGLYGEKTESALGKVALSTSTCKVAGKWKYINTVAWVQCRIGASIDGKFGSGTKEKVVAYQKKRGLTQDGVVGKNTLKALLRDNGVKI